MRILLAIDGSEHSEAAVDEIARRHYPADSEVRVISVVEPPMPLSARIAGRRSAWLSTESWRRLQRERARAAIEKAAAKTPEQPEESANSRSQRKSSPARQSKSSLKKPKRSALI